MNICIVEDCARPVKAKQLCAMHHQRMLRHGDPLTVRPAKEKKRETCKWIHCTKDSVTKGYCSKHYYIQRVSASRQEQ
ncbi:hypothetical protein [Paenibacillus sp. NPDC058071]|uniref:hypothetical protein n=1 Tax=Paenibacillus sp. NPDC058071 TaxID=3346326 RepID=UPI0036DAC475